MTGPVTAATAARKSLFTPSTLTDSDRLIADITTAAVATVRALAVLSVHEDRLRDAD